MQDVKSKMRLFLSVLVVFGILSCEALAVPQESVSTANKAGSLTYVSANDSFTVAYNNAEVLDSEEYVLFAFKGTSESFINPLSNPTSILYVNQYSGTQVKSGVSILLMNTESCAVWLCGRYSSGAKQVLIGTATVASGGPTITTQPTNVTVAAGALGTFKVVASNAVSYQWQVSTNGGSTWVNSGANGNKTATLSFTAATAHNGYKLRCIVTGTNGQKVISNAATVTVY